MTNTELLKICKKLCACEEAVHWLGDKSPAEAWRTCTRPDWMLWIMGKMADKPGWPTRQEVVLAACSCAATALKYVPKKEKRPARAIRIARKWARGTATLTETRDAYDAADAYAYADADAAAAAAYAAYAYAADADADAAAADAYAYAADAYAYAYADARGKARRNMCKIIRREIKIHI